MTQDELIKQEIERLHERSSGDFQTLLRQVEKHRRKVELNLPQMVATLAETSQLYLEWGRGTGKTTIRGDRWSRILSEMPRSTGLFIGPSYQFILTRIIPSLVQGLEMFGLYQNLHYFIGRRPPRGWRHAWGNAFQPPENYNRYITFWNGVGVHLISQDVPGDGRGLNTDWIDGDEAMLLEPDKLQENTDPTLRGTNKRVFLKSKYFGSRFYTSSTPLSPEGKWFIDYEEKAMAEPDKITFISATCEHNRHNLRDGYLEEARRNAYSEWVYLAEYENVRPRFTKDSFYPLLDPDIHAYSNYNYSHYVTPGQAADCRGDSDLVSGIPLIVGVDWGAAINCLTANQHLPSINEYRTLKDFFVLGENQQIQDDLFRAFHEYYQYHDKKDIYLWYDSTGNHRTGNTRQTRAEQAQKLLSGLGWSVKLMTLGSTNPMHELKYLLWLAIMKEDQQIFPRYRMNKHNCRTLYISMRHARTTQGRFSEIKKDKSSEKKSSIPRQEATDLSDANDAPIFGMFYQRLRFHNSQLPGVRTLSK